MKILKTCFVMCSLESSEFIWTDNNEQRET